MCGDVTGASGNGVGLDEVLILGADVAGVLVMVTIVVALVANFFLSSGGGGLGAGGPADTHPPRAGGTPGSRGPKNRGQK